MNTIWARMRSACVTGCGLVSPLGDTLEAFDAALFEGRSALTDTTFTLPGQEPARVAVGRADFDDTRFFSASRLPLDRGTAMALAAARSAMAAARLDAGGVAPERLGVFWGSGMGGAATFDATCRALYAEGRRIRPTSVVTAMPNAPVAELALHFGARGAALGFVCACASAAVAIGEGLRALRDGRVDVALVGGSEACSAGGR